MMTVRFPNGFSIQYNRANFVEHGPDHNILRTRADGGFIAVVPKEAVVEAVSPCRLYNAVSERMFGDLVNQLEGLQREMRSLKRKVIPKRQA
jgi:hypothetical protein